MIRICWRLCAYGLLQVSGRRDPFSAPPCCRSRLFRISAKAAVQHGFKRARWRGFHAKVIQGGADSRLLLPACPAHSLDGVGLTALDCVREQASIDVPRSEGRNSGIVGTIEGFPRFDGKAYIFRANNSRLIRCDNLMDQELRGS
jgi:hypothetical protein